MTPTDPPNSAASLVGMRARVMMLRHDRLMNPTTVVRITRLPLRVANTIPRSASATARTTSTLLVDGMENPVPPPRPAQARKATISTTWTMPPTSELRPTPVTASAGSTPTFWR